MLFHLTTDDHIGIINEQGPAEAHSDGTTFASEQHFHELAKEWPMKRLVAIWMRDEVDPIVWTKNRFVLRWRGGLSKMAAVRPPSIPDLHRCSGRVPAEPCPPSKHFECTASCHLQ